MIVSDGLSNLEVLNETLLLEIVKVMALPQTSLFNSLAGIEDAARRTLVKHLSL